MLDVVGGSQGKKDDDKDKDKDKDKKDEKDDEKSKVNRTKKDLTWNSNGSQPVHDLIDLIHTQLANHQKSLDQGINRGQTRSNPHISVVFIFTIF